MLGDFDNSADVALERPVVVWVLEEHHAKLARSFEAPPDHQLIPKSTRLLEASFKILLKSEEQSY